MSSRKLNKNIEIFTTRVVVEKFPSRVELYNLLDKFIHEHNYPKDYNSDNKDNVVNFIFKNPVRISLLIRKDIGFDFIKFLNFQKMKNPLYSKIKTNLIMDAVNNSSKSKSKSPNKTKNKNQSLDINNSNNNKSNLNISNSSGNIQTENKNDVDYTNRLPRVI